ncbi:MAG TPA: hypothetical protein VF678_03550, partial [bacterium]
MNRTAPRVAAWLALWSAATLGVGAAPLLAQQATPAAAASPATGALSEITGLQLRKDGAQLNLTFLVTKPTPIEVVGNLPRRVLVLKFANTRTAFPDGKSQFLFNDPMVIGVAFEAIDDNTTWAKIRLRTPDLLYQLQQDPTNNRALLGLKVSPTPVGVELTGVRLAQPQKEASQAVMDFTRVPQMVDKVEGSTYVV